MNSIILFLALIGAAYIISNQILPLEELKDYLNNWFNSYKLSQWGAPQQARKYISHLFNCSSCIAFWLILFIMEDWQLALIGYVVAGFVSKHLNSTSL